MTAGRRPRHATLFGATLRFAARGRRAGRGPQVTDAAGATTPGRSLSGVRGRITQRPFDRRRVIGLETSSQPRLYQRASYLAESESLFSGSLNVPTGVIVIEGSWGTGRSVLLHAMCQVAEQAGVRVLRGRGGLFEQHSPLRGVEQLLDSVGGSADWPARARDHRPRMHRSCGP